MTRYTYHLTALLCLVFAAQVGEAQANIREGSFTNAGLTLHYTSQGRGTPVVLLSGGPGLDPDYLQPVVEMIATEHTAILLEQRGTGRSMPTVLDSTSINEGLMIADLDALRKALGYSKWTLLGHSFGTFTAMRYAIAHPSETQALVLLATVPPRSADDHFIDNYTSRFAPATLHRLHEIDEALKSASPEEQKKLKLEEQKLATPPYFFNVENAKPLLSQPGFPPTFEKVNGLLYPEMLHYDMTSGLKQLRMPVLIVQGRQDPLDLEEAGRTRDAIPGAKLVILERCGHFAWLEKADQLRNALLEFLQ
jgi:proline iminopeptidase